MWKEGTNPLQLWALEQLKDAGIEGVSGQDAMDRLRKEGISPLQLWAQKQCEKFGMEDVTARDAIGQLMSFKWGEGINPLQLWARRNIDEMLEGDEWLNLPSDYLDSMSADEIWQLNQQYIAFRAQIMTGHWLRVIVCIGKK